MAIPDRKLQVAKGKSTLPGFTTNKYSRLLTPRKPVVVLLQRAFLNSLK